MLQIRITNADGSDPIILDQAENKTYFKSVNIAEEGIGFEIAKNSEKAEVLNPDTTGYKKFWEVWDTNINERKNRGPITTIAENGPNWKVEGLGRSALLNDFRKSIKTFYETLDSIIDDLRYENIAIQPRATTLVPESTVNTAIFGSTTLNEKFAGLSKQTRDNIIDDNNGLFKPGQIEPPNTYYSTTSFWAGQSTNDSIILDLGGTYNLSKLSLTLPWWGGAQRFNNRTYDFAIDYAEEATNYSNVYEGRKFGTFVELYNSGNDSRVGNAPLTPFRFYIGTTVSGTSLNYNTFYIAQNVPGPIAARFIRTRIRDVHAWYGTVYDTLAPHEGYDYQCDPNYNPGDNPYLSSSAHGVMENKTFNERALEPANDCFASVVELGAYQEIIPRDEIQPLALQRIDDNNLQITYYHVPAAGETITTSNGFRSFEPGGFFRKFHVTYSGANTSYTKFFTDDCTNCYPDGFNFGIMDQNNSLLYATDSTSGTNVSLKAPAYSNKLLMKGASNAVITYVDSWPSVTDAFSYGTSYSFSEVANDYMAVHFRGQSFKWYATVPGNKTGATVRIEIRSKSAPNFTTSWDVNAWSSWSTLENSLILPNNISAELVYEITYESGILQPDTVYEIKITNLDGNFCSVDSFEGYWSGSLTTYNEDSHRISLDDVTKYIQIYDKRFSGGSMYKVSKPARIGFQFVGDRVIIYSAKGVHHGKMRIGLMYQGQGASVYDNANINMIDLVGSDSNKILTVNLGTGKRGSEFPQFVAFDSNDYVPGGLPWGKYSIFVHSITADIEYYNAYDTAELDSFVPRCQDCTTPTGDTISVIKPIYLDGIAAHELLGVSVSFDNETHLDILKAVTEAVQTEADITEDGILVKPRLGIDTDIVLREGQNTIVDYNIVNDISQIASMLVSNGSDIDGLPLFTITEDKATREDLGRTVMRKEDFREVADYFQLIGLSRTSLRKRKKPEKRITVTHTGENFSLEHGDSFILYTKKMGPIRVRAIKITTLESSSSGTTKEMECVRWPQIV